MELCTVFCDDEEEDAKFEENALSRCAVLRSVIGLLNKLVHVYAQHEATFSIVFRYSILLIKVILRPFFRLLERLPLNRYPKVLQDEANRLLMTLKSECKRMDAQTQLSQRKSEKR